MRHILTTVIAGLALLSAAPAGAANNEGIAVVVNQDVITKSSVNSRMELIAASTGMPQTPELMAKLRPQILDMLIEEQIKVQEARRLKIEVSKEEINGGFEQIAKQNNIPAEEFRRMLTSRGIRTGTMDAQIRAQIAWGKVVQKRIRPQIEVSEADIDSELDLIKAKIGRTEYLVSDIFLPVDAQKKDTEVSAFATKLVSQLRQQPDLFPRVAQQFSQAPGAANGGSLGWISEGQLPEDIDRALPALEPGQVSSPIKTPTGYHVLLVRQKRQITQETLPSREEITQRIGTERLDRLQRRYLMDLRSSAYIETRA